MAGKNIRERIKKELDIQDQLLGPEPQTDALRTFLSCIKTGNQWNAFVNCHWMSFAGASHRIYEMRDELKHVFNTLKHTDDYF